RCCKWEKITPVMGVKAGRAKTSSPLVMLLDQPVEQAHAPARAPALVDIGLRRIERGSGNVEMRPWRLVDKPRQQLRRSDRARPAAPGVLHVGEFRVDHLVIFRTEGHTP